MRSANVVRTLSLLAVTAIVGAAVFLVQREMFSGEDAKAGPEVQVAEDDQEWLEIIDQAKRLQSDRDAYWPESVGAGSTVLRSCADVPAAAVESQMAIDYSPDGSMRRVSFVYFLEPESRLHLILYSDGDLTGCSERVKEIVTGPDPYREAVDKHLCEEMARMAQGVGRTDTTLRPASPRVAKAYIAAFCE